MGHVVAVKVSQAQADVQGDLYLLLEGHLHDHVLKGSGVGPLHDDAEAVVLEGGQAEQSDHVGVVKVTAEAGLALEVFQVGASCAHPDLLDGDGRAVPGDLVDVGVGPLGVRLEAGKGEFVEGDRSEFLLELIEVDVVGCNRIVALILWPEL